MVCIYCGRKTQVTNSRHLVRNNTVWRRRHCMTCSAIFTSREAPELATSLMVDNGKSLHPFMKEKLFISVYESCKHRKLATEDAAALTETVLTRIQRQLTAAGVISLSDIRKAAHKTLSDFDPAAATYYTAYFCKK